MEFAQSEIRMGVSPAHGSRDLDSRSGPRVSPCRSTSDGHAAPQCVVPGLESSQV